MKLSHQLVFLLLLSAALNTLVSAQTPTPTPQKVEFIEPPDLNNYKDWKKVYFSEFSIYVPQYFKIEYEWSVDSTFYGFEDKDFIINIHLSRFSPNVSVSKSYENFRERIVVIDNDWAFIWSYEDTYKGFSNVNKVFFYFRNSKRLTSASIFLRSKDKQKGKDLAEKIFYSLKYEKEPPIGEPPPIIRKPQKIDLPAARKVKKEKSVRKEFFCRKVN